MAKVRKIVLDVVKPQVPGIVELGRTLADKKGVDGINISLIEIDRKVENVRITIQGKDIEVDEVFKTIESLGGAIHSIDEVAAGGDIIDHAETLEGK